MNIPTPPEGTIIHNEKRYKKSEFEKYKKSFRYKAGLIANRFLFVVFILGLITLFVTSLVLKINE